MSKPPLLVQLALLSLWGAAVYWWRPIPWHGLDDVFFMGVLMGAPAVFLQGPNPKTTGRWVDVLVNVCAVSLMSGVGGGLICLLVSLVSERL
ncbi:MAG TPA: hypothetical protein VF576_12395 [Rubricoccaceae bacterium]|jgi:hypothetical protein